MSHVRIARFITYVAAVITAAMVLFPPYTSFYGTEFAFIATGPEWSRLAGAAGSDITARLDWALLALQVGALWAISVGARRLLLHPSEEKGNAGRLAPALIASLLLLAAADASAQAPAVGESIGQQGGRFGLGFASAWPAYGISGTMQVNEQITAEAVAGFLGSVSNFGGRGWYRFRTSPLYDLYGYGGASLYTYDYGIDTESVLGIGFGGGIESGLQALFDDATLPPIFLNLEFGLSFASFEYYGGFSAIGFGAGAHWRFGN